MKSKQSELKPISLEDAYLDSNLQTYVGKWKNEHRQAVSKLLNPEETLYYFYWHRGSGSSSLYGTQLYLVSNQRIISFEPQQYYEKDTILRTRECIFDSSAKVSFQFDKKFLGSSFDVDIEFHADKNSLASIQIFDVAKKEFEKLESMVALIKELIEKTKNIVEGDNSLVSKIKQLFEMYKTGDLKEEDYKSAMQKLFDDAE